MRNNGGNFRLKCRNKYLRGSLVLALLLTCVVIFVDPIAEVFSLATDFGFDEFVIAACLALTSIVVVEIVKAIERAVHKKKMK
ncbi:MAG: cation transporting ATPase C-terminal domain-containing protein [Eubacteriales bacterium]|nr:cation transporting ATPase C-terminal domain-containing protein [Eubacteriales bacterium]